MNRIPSRRHHFKTDAEQLKPRRAEERVQTKPLQVDMRKPLQVDMRKPLQVKPLPMPIAKPKLPAMNPLHRDSFSRPSPQQLLNLLGGLHGLVSRNLDINDMFGSRNNGLAKPAIETDPAVDPQIAYVGNGSTCAPPAVSGALGSGLSGVGSVDWAAQIATPQVEQPAVEQPSVDQPSQSFDFNSSSFDF